MDTWNKKTCLKKADKPPTKAPVPFSPVFEGKMKSGAPSD